MLYLVAILIPVLCGLYMAVTGMGRTEKTNKSFALLAGGFMLLCDVASLLAAFFDRGDLVLPLTENARILLCADGLSRLFVLILSILYTAVCFYGFSYLKEDERKTSFYACFFFSYAALTGVAFAGTLISLYAFFESATLLSMPLVLHDRTKEAVDAAKKYLFYSIGGALMGLFCILVVSGMSEQADCFVYGGFLDPESTAAPGPLFFIAVCFGIVGFGTKAGIWPMHGWLPTAHPIAPAPASSLLSGIIAKSGVLALIRLLYFAIGPKVLKDTPVQSAFMILCMLTILVGSSMAFLEPVLKKRLAYSTVSQISYILLGLSLFSGEGLQGGLLQLVSHACAKGCLFLCAGTIIHTTGHTRVEDLSGIGKRLPVTMWCFLISSLSLIGIPPMGGFSAKWQLTAAALSAGKGVLSYLPPAVLLISAMLTAGYLLPVVIAAFFPGRVKMQKTQNIQKTQTAQNMQKTDTEKEPLLMIVPMIVLCALALLAGLFGSYIPILFPMY